MGVEPHSVATHRGFTDCLPPHMKVGVVVRSNLRYLSNFLPPAATLGIIGDEYGARTRDLSSDSATL